MCRKVATLFCAYHKAFAKIAWNIDRAGGCTMQIRAPAFLANCNAALAEYSSEVSDVFLRLGCK
jgi:hypothetical protein